MKLKNQSLDDPTVWAEVDRRTQKVKEYLRGHMREYAAGLTDVPLNQEILWEASRVVLPELDVWNRSMASGLHQLSCGATDQEFKRQLTAIEETLPKFRSDLIAAMMMINVVMHELTLSGEEKPPTQTARVELHNTVNSIIARATKSRVRSRPDRG